MLDEYVNRDDGKCHAIFRMKKPSDPLNATQKGNFMASITCRLQH
jgi:hypothetical protein